MEHMYRMLCVQLIDAMTSLVTVNGLTIYITHTELVLVNENLDSFVTMIMKMSTCMSN